MCGWGSHTWHMYVFRSASGRSVCTHVYVFVWGLYVCVYVSVWANSSALTSCCDGAPQRRLFAVCGTIQMPNRVVLYCRRGRVRDVLECVVVDYLR